MILFRNNKSDKKLKKMAHIMLTIGIFSLMAGTLTYKLFPYEYDFIKGIFTGLSITLNTFAGVTLTKIHWKKKENSN